MTARKRTKIAESLLLAVPLQALILGNEGFVGPFKVRRSRHFSYHLFTVWPWEILSPLWACVSSFIKMEMMLSLHKAVVKIKWYIQPEKEWCVVDIPNSRLPCFRPNQLIIQPTTGMLPLLQHKQMVRTVWSSDHTGLFCGNHGKIYESD